MNGHHFLTFHKLVAILHRYHIHLHSLTKYWPFLLRHLKWPNELSNHKGLITPRQLN